MPNAPKKPNTVGGDELLASILLIAFGFAAGIAAGWAFPLKSGDDSMPPKTDTPPAKTE